ncbi:PREDICTED: E3 ubiquitin-protein ligase RING1-like [Camelina sativa]|uniref:RING-type E3 ubiquitin transferase n=1 Tax=Camelina sativa TaxID=90675 RepID=A0ABM0ZP99_CAMSA|nr:PREDICTED: E3 ubiquitin-protein ligase RING1-like [Camelina sativa]
MICNECENDAFDEGDDGFIYCRRCGLMADDLLQIGSDQEDFFGEVAAFTVITGGYGSRRFRDIENGRPPASRWTIEMLPSVAVVEKGECVICLEEWGKGEVAAELPCKHKYHLECVKKWLKIHASCPQCRYKMPLEGEEEVVKNVGTSVLDVVVDEDFIDY